MIADTTFGAPAWTSSGSAGSIIDAVSILNSAAGNLQEGNNGSVTFNNNRTGTITLRYNVVNTAVLPMNQSTGHPPWTTFELAYIMPTGSMVTATLYRLPACSQAAQMVCQIPTVETPVVKCDVCNFPNNTFNYFTDIYFVEVILNRPNTGVTAPAVCSLRIKNP